MSKYFGYDGKPISFDEWLKLWQGNRRVARDEKDDVLVMTSYLGMEGAVFETLVRVGGEDAEIQRSDNLEAARKMHEEMKKKWMGGEDGEDED